MKIYLVRHGETDYNKKGLFQGQKDIPLNEEGRAQAEKLALRFEDKFIHDGEQIAAIYCSPLSRAKDTAQAIGTKLNLKPFPDSGLKEIDMGEWEGKTAKQISEEYKDENGVPLLKKWQEDPVSNDIPGGEKVADLDVRTAKTIESIMQKHLPTESIVLVAHMGPIGAALCHVLGKNLKEIAKNKTDNASVTIIDVKNDLDHSEIIVQNDTSHLKEYMAHNVKPDILFEAHLPETGKNETLLLKKS